MKNLEKQAHTESSALSETTIETPLNWNKNSWQNYTVKQIPQYDIHKMNQVQKQLQQEEALVSLASIKLLKYNLQNINDGKHFIVQMGECAETFAQSTKYDISS